MPKNILFLHGWEGSSQEHWFPLAKEKFQKLGYRMEIPDMPGAYFPKKSEWVRSIQHYHPDKNWILIGHSLGGVAILRYLEIAEEPIAQAVLLATPYEPMKFNPIANFFDEDFDWSKIKSNCSKFEILNETDDPLVPYEHGKIYAEKLGGNLHKIPGGTHFHRFDLNLLINLLK